MWDGGNEDYGDEGRLKIKYVGVWGGHNQSEVLLAELLFPLLSLIRKLIFFIIKKIFFKENTLSNI